MYRANIFSADIRPSRNSRADQAFFTLGLCLWLFCRVLQTSYYANQAGTLLMLGVYCGLTLCILAELFSKGLNLRAFALGAITLTLIVLLNRVGGNDIVIMLIIAFTSRRYRLKDVLRFALPVLVVAVLFVIMSSEFGIIDQTYVNDGGRLRGSLGFGWVTFLSHYFLEFAMCYAVLRGNRIKLWEIGLLLIINVMIWVTTVSRNSFILTGMFLVLLCIIRAAKHWSCGKLWPIIAAASYPISAGISWILFVMVNPYSGIGYTLNTFFSGRISLTQQALNIYGINAFGNIVTWVTQSSIRSGMFMQSQYLYVDCSYLNEIINYGWLTVGLLMVALAIVAYNATKHAGILMGLALIFFAIHGIVDPQLLDLHYCLLLLLLGNVFDDNKEWKNRTINLSPAKQDSIAEESSSHDTATPSQTDHPEAMLPER